ncbi:thiamine-phosphate kinase [Arthrobacter rhombi]|uniref:thiamine-phosphate kinase n=1 Tax=Arthrobacter rhombi TaxID=71253 RepID=UPI003FCF5AD8
MAKTSDQEVTVAGLGEAGVLKRILPRLRGADMLLGPGDDAAIIGAPGGRFVFTIDTLVQDQDFRLNWRNGYQSSGYDVGWKSAAQNLSDINAMGALATAAVISLTLPPETPVAWVEGIADGFTAAVKELGADHCALAGGDLSSGSELSITAALTGSLPGPAMLRSGARPGDIVAVSGVLGAAAAGLALLESEHDFTALDALCAALVERQRRPRPPLFAGPLAAAAGATAAMDISDGLGRDAGRIARSSGVVVDISSAALHRRRASMVSEGIHLEAAARVLGFEALGWMLTGGEDHGLLACFPGGAVLPSGFHVVGNVLERPAEAPGSSAIAGAVEGDVLLDGLPLSAALESLRTSGFDHFGG